MEELNIFQRMSKISTEIKMVGKNLVVGYGKNQYKAVSEGDVLRAVKTIERQNGVYSYPISRDVIDTNVLTSNSGNKQLFMRIKTTYRFVNMDKPTEYIDIVTFGDGVDSQDKASGKAMTYADKYALLKAYKIETGDDPDQFASEPLEEVGDETPYNPKIEFLRKIYTGEKMKTLLEKNNVTRIEYLPTDKVDELFEKLSHKAQPKATEEEKYQVNKKIIDKE